MIFYVHQHVHIQHLYRCKKTIKFMLITNLISRYMQLCKAAFSAGDGLKLNKSIQINVMEMLFLLMVILIFFYALFALIIYCTAKHHLL